MAGRVPMLRMSRRFLAHQCSATRPVLISLEIPRAQKGGSAAWERIGFETTTIDPLDSASGRFIQCGGVLFDLNGEAPSIAWNLHRGECVRAAQGGATAAAAAAAASSRAMAELAEIDGIPTTVAEYPTELLEEMTEAYNPHRNRALGLYSLVILTPDLQRTVDAMSAAGLQLRRIADPSPASDQLAMAFFKLGSPLGQANGAADVIVELVAPREPGREVSLPGFAPFGGEHHPATLGGVMFTVPCLEHLPEVVGEGLLGKARPAVQGKGRRVAPIRHEQAGLPLAVAFITPPCT
jgi:hypothetical protein